MQVQITPKGLLTWASGKAAIEGGVAIARDHIRGQLIMRLGLYGLAALFVITAALLAVFAPDGRQTLTYVIAIALFALAVGAAGFGAFAIKTPLGQATAGEGPEARLPEFKPLAEGLESAD